MDVLQIENMDPGTFYIIMCWVSKVTEKSGTLGGRRLEEKAAIMHSTYITVVISNSADGELAGQGKQPHIRPGRGDLQSQQWIFVWSEACP